MSKDILENYFFDLYAVLLKILARFFLGNDVPAVNLSTLETDEKKLRSTIEEIIKIRRIIVERKLHEIH